MNPINECPECRSVNVGKGKLSGYAAIMPIGKIFSSGSPIIANICTECGYIINMYVEKPEKFINR